MQVTDWVNEWQTEFGIGERKRTPTPDALAAAVICLTLQVHHMLILPFVHTCTHHTRRHPSSSTLPPSNFYLVMSIYGISLEKRENEEERNLLHIHSMVVFILSDSTRMIVKERLDCSITTLSKGESFSLTTRDPFSPRTSACFEQLFYIFHKKSCSMFFEQKKVIFVADDVSLSFLISIERNQLGYDSCATTKRDCDWVWTVLKDRVMTIQFHSQLFTNSFEYMGKKL